MKILKLNELDFLILKILINHNQATSTTIKEELKRYNEYTKKFKYVSYSYLQSRISFLNALNLITVGFNQPHKLSIKIDKVRLIRSYISLLLEIEQRLDGDKQCMKN